MARMARSAGVGVEARLRRGACPSVHSPFDEPDGALARVRLPGGRLPAAAAGALAAAVGRAGAGPIELTNRANVQVRGVPADAVAGLRDELVTGGLVARDAAVDERRNVLASPTAGVDRCELVDTGPVVAAVVERLTSTDAPECSPKFGVLVDGGGEVGVRGRVHDLALGAVRTGDGRVVFEVRLAEALADPAAPGEVAWTVPPAAVPDVVDAVLAACAPDGRAADAIAARGRDRVWDDVRRVTGDALTCRVMGADASRSARADAVGVHAQRDAALVWIGARAVLGRLDAAQLGALASVAATHGGEIRVTPWRGVVLTDVGVDRADGVVCELEDLGLVCDPAHPANVVVACAGSTGCAAGLVDVQRDAWTLIGALCALPRSRRPQSVHVSGCEKGCACPGPTEVSMVGSAPDRYDVFAGGPDDGSRFGRPRATSVPPAGAIGSALDAGVCP